MIVSVGLCQPQVGQQAPSVTSTFGIPQHRLRPSTTAAPGSLPMRAPPTSCTNAPGGGATQNRSSLAGNPSRPGSPASPPNLRTVRPPPARTISSTAAPMAWCIARSFSPHAQLTRTPVSPSPPRPPSSSTRLSLRGSISPCAITSPSAGRPRRPAKPRRWITPHKP